MPKRDLLRRIDTKPYILDWRRVRDIVFPHHTKHEAGGDDAIALNLDDLADVSAYRPGDGQVLTYDIADERWIAEDIPEVRRGVHQAYLGYPIPTSVIPPGPTNITGAAYHVIAVRIEADGECSGNLSFGGSFGFAFGAAGGDMSWDYTASPITWANGAGSSMYLIYPATTTATFIKADIALQEAT